MIFKSMSSFKLLAGLCTLALLPACSISFGGGPSDRMEKEMSSLRSEVSRLRAELAQRDSQQGASVQLSVVRLHEQRAQMVIQLAGFESNLGPEHPDVVSTKARLQAIDAEIFRLQGVDH
jgi:capsule polysaccharide export protein KpsE/RkpR